MEILKYIQEKTDNDLCAIHPDPLPAVRLQPERFPRFNALDQAEATRALVQIIAGVFISFAKEASEEILLVMAVQLWNDINAESELFVKNITFEEINRAILWAKAGGELYANEASMFRAICSYYKTVSIPTASRWAGRTTNNN